MKEKLSIYVEPDEKTAAVAVAFDYNFTGTTFFTPHEKPEVPEVFNIGVIYGASGTGKTILLKEFGSEERYEWDNTKAIISNFDTAEEGIDKLTAVGLNSIPAWCKPYFVLSNGEKFRADLAKQIKENAVIDEFTSVVDRNVAKSSSYALQKYLRNKDIRGVVLATVHEDVLEWLEPDWIFNTNTGQMLVGRSLRRPELTLEIHRCKPDLWGMFKNHHYLTASLPRGVICYVGMIDGRPVAFDSVMAFPSKIKNAWREVRIVVLPEFQGLGIGNRFSEAVCQMVVDSGKRIFSRGAHINVGRHREKSPLWRPTSANRRIRKRDNAFNGWGEDGRRCWSHEYIGKLPLDKH